MKILASGISRNQLTVADYTSQNTPSDESHTYDANGNRTHRFVDNDADGQPSRYDSDITQYFWDHRNRLTRVHSRDSYHHSDGPVTNNVYYYYDAFNRLVRRLEDPDGDGPSSYLTTFYINDGTNPILQFDGTAATDLSHRYLWGPAVDQILADETVDDGGTEDILWPFADFQGSIRHLAKYDPQTITTTIVNHKFYDTFGNLTSETNPTISHLFAYTGRPFDTTTGLQNNLNRWYDPKLGRWLSEDPIGFEASDPNLYRYVENQPTLRIDPDGLDSTWWAGTKGTFAGTGQGVCNIANGLQDTGIGILNIPGMAVNGIAWVEEKAGILDPNDSLRVPYIPSPEWSRDLVTSEAGEGWTDSHNWSKIVGAGGVELLSGAWASKVSKARKAAQATGLVDDAAETAAKCASRVADDIVRTSIPKNTTVLAVVKDGKILAQSADQVMSHSQFVSRTIGSVPEGAEVITILKTKSGEIITMRSITFHQNALPASQSTLDTVLKFFQ